MGIMSDSAGRDDQKFPDYRPYPSKDHIPEEDDGTLYRDDESYTSDEESIFSDDSSICPPPATWKEYIPALRVDKADGQKEVFECWNLFIVPDRKKIISGTKVLGINFKEWDHLRGSVSAVSQVKTQSELAETYRTAIASHESSTRCSWPSRVVRGRAESYEQDLEKRCRKLPPQLKDSIRDLLWERGYASSTAHHERTWTVVHMEERWVHRFTRTKGAKVDRHKVRFWKNPKTEQMTECFVIIRGGETGTPDAKTGYTRPDVSSNPWVDVDTREISRMVRQERPRSRIARTRERIQSISRSPDLTRYRRRDFRQSMRDRSCDSIDDDYYHWRREPDESDFEPPEPEFRSRPRFCGPIPRISRCFPRAPSPPGSFPPPPAVAAFHQRGPMVPPPPPPPPPPAEWSAAPAPENPFYPRASNPFFSAGPCPPYAWNAPAPPPPPAFHRVGCNLPGFGSMSFPHPPPPLGRLKSLCLSCKATPNCPHFPGSLCYRAVRYTPDTDTGEAHYDCLDCSEGPRIWHRTVARCDDADDTATVLDEDDVASENNGVAEASEDGEDTQTEELAEMPATAEKEA